MNVHSQVMNQVFSDHYLKFPIFSFVTLSKMQIMLSFCYLLTTFFTTELSKGKSKSKGNSSLPQK